MNHELPDVQAVFRKGRGTRGKIANIVGSLKKQYSSRKTSISALLPMSKPLTVLIIINCGKFWKRWEYQTTWLPPEKSVCRSKATVRTGHGATDWFQNIKAVYCHPAYLSSMQSTSCKMSGWMKHKLKSRFLGEISITSGMQMTLLLWQKVKRN